MRFDEKKHQYFRHGSQYIGATTLIGRYKPKYDSDYWSTYKAVKDILERHFKWGAYKRKAGGWEGVVHYYRKNKAGRYDSEIADRKQYYLDKWKKAGEVARKKGKEVHAMLEESTRTMDRLEKMDGVVLFPSTKDILEVQNFHQNGSYAELIVYDDEYELAGTCDLVNKRGKTVHLKDYKTSKVIEKEPFRGETFKPPLKHLPCANFYEYALQISLYAWMLERRGYEIGDLVIEHRGRDDGYLIASYKMPYLKADVVRMIRDYHKKRKRKLKK